MDKRSAGLERDLQWLREAKEGNLNRLQDLVMAYWKSIRYVAWKYGIRSENDLEEIYQDLIIRLLEKLQKLQIKSSFGGYLSSMLRTIIRERRRGPQITEIEDRFNTSEPGPQKMLELNEIRQAVVDCKGTLNEREARAFEARFFEEIPYSDLAKEFAVTSNNLYVILHRALEKMRSCLESKGVSLGTET